jgi:hypothetical protein
MYSRIRSLRSACYSPRPSAGEAHGGTPTDPVKKYPYQLTAHTCGFRKVNTCLHDTQNANGANEPEDTNHDDQDVLENTVLHFERTRDSHVPQYFGELSMSERQSPQPQVRSRM